jgi:hypothetical protein
MPVTLPSPAEFSGLSWRSRDKAIIAARNLLRAYGGAVAEDMTGDHYRIARERNATDNARWAERVREEARRLERESNRRAGVQR